MDATISAPAQGRGLLKADEKTLRFYALALAVLIYAFFGSPSPDHPGWAEGATGLLLVVAVGIPSFYRIFNLRKAPPFRLSGAIFFVYGITIAAVVGILQGNNPALVLRDVPAFLFLFLPLLAADIFENRPQFFRVFICLFLFQGFIFAWRSLGETSYFNPALSEDTRELYYFANSPAVLAAAIFPALYAGENYFRTLRLCSLPVLFAAAAFIFLPVLAMALTLQRASLGWVILSFFIFGLHALWRTPYRILPAVAAVVFIMWFWREQAGQIFDLLAHKTAVYGINKRGLEIAAVWQEIAANPLSMIFGLGWGGTFESPAVGGVRVNYTHSLISSLLLKTGVAGLALGGCYISWFFIALAKLWRREMILVLGLSGPLIIDTFLYASYKWLDFGLLLLLIRAAAELHRSGGYCIHKG